MLAKLFDVGDEMPRRIVFQTRVRRALPRPALVEKHDAIGGRVEEAPVVGDRPAAGAAVQEDDGHAFGVAALFVVKRMHRRHRQHASIVRFDLRIQVSHKHIIQRLEVRGQKQRSKTEVRGQRSVKELLVFTDL